MIRLPTVQSEPATEAGQAGSAEASPAWSRAAGNQGSSGYFNVLLITFASSIFNAGAFITVFPFIVARVYDGTAWLLALLMAVFFAGATLSNILLLRYQPLLRPGRLFLIMQLSRIW